MAASACRRLRPRRSLDRSLTEPRAVKSLLLTLGAWLVAMIAELPLFSVLYMLIMRGGARLGMRACSPSCRPPGFMPGGGFGNAIVGTLVMVGDRVADQHSDRHPRRRLPGRYRPDTRLTAAARFLSKVLTGFPSILAGVFGFAILVLTFGTYSALAGGVALAVLMLPTVILTAENAMRTVPTRMKEAARRHGLHADPGGLQGGAADRDAGHPDRHHAGASPASPANRRRCCSPRSSATSGSSSLLEPTASLSILIYNFSGMPFPNQIELAWAASLVLVLIVLSSTSSAAWSGGRKSDREGTGR